MASRETCRSDFSRYWSGSLRTAGCAKVVAKTPAPTSMAHRTSSDRSASRGRVLTRLPTATLRPRIKARGERSTNADTLDRFAMTAFDDDDSTGAIGRRLRPTSDQWRSEEHTSELQSHSDLVCRLLLEKKKKNKKH